MKKKVRLKKGVFVFLLLIFSSGIIFSGYKIVNWKLNTNKNKDIKDDINKNIKVDEGQKKVNNKYKVDFKKLKKMNADTVGYIKVNNTGVEYVVVKGKDNDYYLNHNFNKEYNIAGWIFADYRNQLDGSDKNTIIYGHNMKDNSMFGSLTKVLESNWQKDEANQKILFITERKAYYYQIFSTYMIEPEDYYITTDFSSNDSYLKFLEIIKKRSNNDYQVELNPNDRIITLSTCNATGSKRIVVHAKRISE